MTKGDKIRLRAELAGKAMQGLLSDQATMAAISKDAGRLNVSPTAYLGSASVEYADAVMAALGLSLDNEPEHDPTLRNPTIEEIIGED